MMGAAQLGKRALAGVGLVAVAIILATPLNAAAAGVHPAFAGKRPGPVSGQPPHCWIAQLGVQPDDAVRCD